MKSIDCGDAGYLTLSLVGTAVAVTTTAIAILRVQPYLSAASKKPFSIIAEGTQTQKWRGLRDAYRNWVIENLV